ncbi:hypothetical protein [Geotalea uraniireducens]|uniref:hypothetical protein n=1 Tax=Geotalea uraniireducens TaxID=351604 RepID=UPI0012EE1867|nr:hypothetical protein [Geotalea uraniireducens]
MKLILVGSHFCGVSKGLGCLITSSGIFAFQLLETFSILPRPGLEKSSAYFSYFRLTQLSD